MLRTYKLFINVHDETMTKFDPWSPFAAAPFFFFKLKKKQKNTKPKTEKTQTDINIDSSIKWIQMTSLCMMFLAERKRELTVPYVYYTTPVAWMYQI